MFVVLSYNNIIFSMYRIYVNKYFNIQIIRIVNSVEGIKGKKLLQCINGIHVFIFVTKCMSENQATVVGKPVSIRKMENSRM